MIRFIDLGKQIAVDETDPDYPSQFAFFDTIGSNFISMDTSYLRDGSWVTTCGEQVFASWAEVEECVSESPTKEELEFFARLKRLCPEWVFQPVGVK